MIAPSMLLPLWLFTICGFRVVLVKFCQKGLGQQIPYLSFVGARQPMTEITPIVLRPEPPVAMTDRQNGAQPARAPRRKSDL